MQKIEEKLWTWVLPDIPGDENRREWIRNGGKWIVFDRKDGTERLANQLGSFIDSGKIKSAKYWNGDPGALCVYSLHNDRWKTLEVLKGLGAERTRVWEYDYAWDKNFLNPFNFIYSQSSKFRTILKSYGCRGTFELIREVMPQRITGSQAQRLGPPSERKDKNA
jgi:hypothetical protein